LNSFSNHPLRIINDSRGGLRDSMCCIAGRLENLPGHLID